MGIYDNLGIKRIINANATLTKLGGSLMPPEVVQAMAEAAASFIDLHELQKRVGERIAELTRNEACYVSSGAAAGLVLATAACVTGGDPDAICRLPGCDGLKNEVIVHRSQRNGYDHAVRTVGIDLVEIGSANETSAEELERAITPNTAAIIWFQGAMCTPGDLPLADVIRIAKAHDVPVIVDAAAQLPPASNLWNYTRMGAALAIFSGGKDLRGPQSSGLILGRRDLIEACAVNGSPNHSIGRPMKVGKEEMAGLLAAVERYLALDHDARAESCERIVRDWCDALNRIPGVSARRDFPNEACQPLPRCLVTLDALVAGISSSQVIDRLMGGDPAVSVAPCGEHGFFLNPMTLEPGEEEIVVSQVRAVLGDSGRNAGSAGAGGPRAKPRG